MKNTWIVVAFLLVAVSVSAQETVSSVSFNPARLGNFEKLKVSNSATLRGGLQTNKLELNGTTGGQVAVNSSQPINLKSVSVAADVPANRVISFFAPDAVFHLNGISATPYTFSTSSAVPAGRIPVRISGGTLDFSSGDSFIQNLVTNNNLIAYAKKITVNGTLNVMGDRSVPLQGSADSSEYIRGLKLDQTVIPDPREGNVVEYRPSADSDFTQPARLDLTNCELAWLERRVTKDVAEAEYVLGWKDKAGAQCLPSGDFYIPGTMPRACSTIDSEHPVGTAYHSILRKGQSDQIVYLKRDGTLCDNQGATDCDWDTSECEAGWKWRRIAEYTNEYLSPGIGDPAYTDNGFNYPCGLDTSGCQWYDYVGIALGAVWRLSCVEIEYCHKTGIDDTRCGDSSPRLYIGDSVHVLSDGVLSTIRNISTNEWNHHDFGEATIHRLIKNHVNRPTHTGDKIIPAPTCNAYINHNKEIEEGIYALHSWAGAWGGLSIVGDWTGNNGLNLLFHPGDALTHCIGVGNIIKYRCTNEENPS